jgi:hypothetical protein
LRLLRLRHSASMDRVEPVTSGNRPDTGRATAA